MINSRPCGCGGNHIGSLSSSWWKSWSIPVAAYEVTRCCSWWSSWDHLGCRKWSNREFRCLKRTALFEAILCLREIASGAGRLFSPIRRGSFTWFLGAWWAWALSFGLLQCLSKSLQRRKLGTHPRSLRHCDESFRSQEWCLASLQNRLSLVSPVHDEPKQFQGWKLEVFHNCAG